jgi:hypothetical protein
VRRHHLQVDGDCARDLDSHKARKLRRRSGFAEADANLERHLRRKRWRAGPPHGARNQASVRLEAFSPATKALQERDSAAHDRRVRRPDLRSFWRVANLVMELW